MRRLVKRKIMSGGTEKPRNMDFMGTSFEKPQNCQPGMRKSDWSTVRLGTDVSAFP